MRKKLTLPLLASVLFLGACSFVFTTQSQAGEQGNKRAAGVESSSQQQDTEAEKAVNMQIILDGKTYSVALNDNKTTEDILSKMPLELSMVRFAGHEYYAELPFRPTFDETRTSRIKAGHVYYWDGWNAFVINYVDYDISPYQVVHIGEITDISIVDVLSGAAEQIRVQVTQGQ